MANVTVEIEQSSHPVLQQISKRTGEPIEKVLSKAIDDLRRKQFFAEMDAAYSELQSNEEAWREELEERKIWEATLKMPNFCDAIKKNDFLRAAGESQLSNMSKIKNEDHRLLFTDAAYVVEQRADDPAAFTYLPTKLSGWMPLYAQMGIQGQNTSQ
jgi:hypothetical protein